MIYSDNYPNKVVSHILAIRCNLNICGKDTRRAYPAHLRLLLYLFFFFFFFIQSMNVFFLFFFHVLKKDK